MAYFNRPSDKEAAKEPIGAAALRGTGLSVAEAQGAPPPKRKKAKPAEVTVKPAEPLPSQTGHLEASTQAEALQSAAKDGTPFCEECAKGESESEESPA